MIYENDIQFGIENGTWPSHVYSALPECRSPMHSVVIIAISVFMTCHSSQDIMN